MYFQQALVTVMDNQQVSVQELAARTGADSRWILSITTNCNWKPKLDTILRLCHALRFNVFSFMALAEKTGSWNLSPISQYQYHDSYLADHLEQIIDLKPRHISLALKAFRVACGLSQHQLEKLTPFNVHAISTRESNRYQNYPTMTTLCSYCIAYNITLEEFVVRAFSFIDMESPQSP